MQDFVESIVDTENICIAFMCIIIIMEITNVYTVYLEAQHVSKSFNHINK